MKFLDFGIAKLLKDLHEAVDLYDQRFGIGFTDDEKDDLVAFLRTL